MKKIFFFFLLQFSNKIFAQKKLDSVQVSIVSSYGYIPSPFLAVSAMRIKLPIWNTSFSKKLFPETVYFNPSQTIITSNDKYRPLTRTLYPTFTRFYDSTSSWSLSVPQSNSFYIVTGIQPLNQYDWGKIIQPFWFKKTEVTNAEYKEFVQYVKDSIIRNAFSKLDEKYINKDYPINFTFKEMDSMVPQLMLSRDNRIFGRKEFDIENLIYQYQDKDGTINNVKIYPDTLVWMRDFAFANNYQLTESYFYHPMYDDYPVVGITWQQSKAYCNWITQKLQKENPNLYEGYTLEADFPYDYEREFVITSFNAENSDHWWLTDLKATSNPSSIVNSNLPSLLLGNGTILYDYNSSFKKDAFFFTHPADILQLLHSKKKFRNSNGDYQKLKDISEMQKTY
jgi:hypothetical protein